jgi:mannose-6-phosphate isomerase-like protein (cupin superfamily)
MIERITSGGVELAIILRRDYEQTGIEFFTADAATMQLGYMKRPVGYVIQPHIHRPVRRETHYTEEVLFIRSGRVRVDFYDEEQSYLQSATLEAGDVVLLARGGHGFEMLAPTEMIEVKQGPYVGDRDKERFEIPAEKRTSSARRPE